MSGPGLLSSTETLPKGPNPGDLIVRLPVPLRPLPPAPFSTSLRFASSSTSVLAPCRPSPEPGRSATLALPRGLWRSPVPGRDDAVSAAAHQASVSRPGRKRRCQCQHKWVRGVGGRLECCTSSSGGGKEKGVEEVEEVGGEENYLTT